VTGLISDKRGQKRTKEQEVVIEVILPSPDE
jgi:hypothetical protein